MSRHVAGRASQVGWVEVLEPRRLMAAGTLGFAFPIAAADRELVTGQATDRAGNLYVVGELRNAAVDFNPSPRKSFVLTPTGNGNAFVAKYTAAGSLAWAKLLNGPQGQVTVHDVAIDPHTGDVLVA